MHKDPENRFIDFKKATIIPSGNTLVLLGDWTWCCLSEQILDNLYINKNIENIDARKIASLDSSGAFFITQILKRFSKANQILHIELNEKHQSLYELIAKNTHSKIKEKRAFSPFDIAYRIGAGTSQIFRDLFYFLGFIGEVAETTIQGAKAPWKLRGKLVFDIIYSAGYQAVGIICLLAFLIGVVLAYQIGGQLLQYGANIFVVNLLGISLLREFAPLITAIIVAGRSGSAFAAQIGTMKVQEEVDALRTFGITPIGRLVLPRIFGLLISLPILVIFADIASVFGGMVMSKAFLGLGFGDFLSQFAQNISFSTYMIGLVKTPVFALIIASVGCYRGLNVRGDAASIGEETTKSVVYSIFLIIIADAIFSILFSFAGL